MTQEDMLTLTADDRTKLRNLTNVLFQTAESCRTDPKKRAYLSEMRRCLMTCTNNCYLAEWSGNPPKWWDIGSTLREKLIGILSRIDLDIDSPTWETEVTEQIQEVKKEVGLLFLECEAANA